MRRVTKAEVIAMDRVNTPDGLEICLDCWKQYMHSDGDRDLGAKTMSGLKGDDSYGNGMDIYDQQQASDLKVGAATDAMIDSLPLRYKWAIYKLTSIGYSYDYPHGDVLLVGPAAKEALRDKLRNNCCTSVLFD
jgi:hypothetical protein